MELESITPGGEPRESDGEAGRRAGSGLTLRSRARRCPRSGVGPRRRPRPMEPPQLPASTLVRSWILQRLDREHSAYLPHIAGCGRTASRAAQACRSCGGSAGTRSAARWQRLEQHRRAPCGLVATLLLVLRPHADPVHRRDEAQPPITAPKASPRSARFLMPGLSWLHTVTGPGIPAAVPRSTLTDPGL